MSMRAALGKSSEGGASRFGGSRLRMAGACALLGGLVVGLVPAIGPGPSAAAGVAALRAATSTPARTRSVAMAEDAAALAAMRDTVAGVLLRGAPPGDSAIHVVRDTTVFAYQYARATARACRVRMVVNDTTPCPVSAFERWLNASGWMHHPGYDADSPDGTVFAYDRGRLFCLVEGSWDGGDDSDSTVVPVPGCTLTVTLAPLRMDDTLRWEPRPR